MSVAALIPADDIRLRRACFSVGRVNKRHRKTADRLREALAAYCGIGIAAPQIGVTDRICVVLRDWKPGLVPLPMFDPVIVAWSKEEIIAEEGCLSFPGETVRVRRHEHCIVRHMTPNGDTVETLLGGIEAACAQHEIDHLNGIPFQMRAEA